MNTITRLFLAALVAFSVVACDDGSDDGATDGGGGAGAAGGAGGEGGAGAAGGAGGAGNEGGMGGAGNEGGIGGAGNEGGVGGAGNEGGVGGAGNEGGVGGEGGEGGAGNEGGVGGDGGAGNEGGEGGEGGGEPPLEAYSAEEVQTLFNRTCAGCHTGGGASGGLALDNHLDTVGRQAFSVGINLVTAGDRDASYIYHKIAGTHRDVGGNGSPMPLGGSLTAEEIERYGLWIDGLTP